MSDKMDAAENQFDGLRVALENERIALRNREADVERLQIQRLGLLGCMVGLCVVMGVAWEIRPGSTCPAPLPGSVRFAGEPGRRQREVALPGSPAVESRPDLFPLVVSTENNPRCFSIDYKGTVDRDRECGYEIDVPLLTKALCPVCPSDDCGSNVGGHAEIVGGAGGSFDSRAR